MHQLNTKVAFPVYPRWRGEHFADTGNTERLAVYPRWRGEHTDCGICSVQILGLSPLARGTLNHQPDHQLPHRFIPAGAGNTGITVIHWPPISVYPRWRGEHCNSLISDLPRLGLSPLARGTPVPGRGCISILRFIPLARGTRDGSGYYTRRRRFIPLARGTRCGSINWSANPRFIPAGAGTRRAPTE